MAKLSTYVEQLTSTLGAVVDTSVGTGTASIVSSAFQIYSGNTGSDRGRANVPGSFGGDIDESEVYFEITALPTAGICDITIADSGENGYQMRLTSTQWTLSRMVGGSTTTLSGPTTWSAASHKWLRVREASGTTHFEFAPDSGAGAPGTWTSVYSEATTSSGWTHTAVDVKWVSFFAGGEGTSRYRYLNTTAPVVGGPKLLALLGVG